MKSRSLKRVTLFLLLVLSAVAFVPQTLTASKTSDLGQHQYLTGEQYATLDEMFQTHLNYYLDPAAITSSGLPLTAFRVGDRARFGYSNPTEWGYALQAWITAAERGIITQSEAVGRMETALATMQALQQDQDESYQGMFYPFYTMTDPDGNDLPAPVHSTFSSEWFMIPSGDLALLYASLYISEGWANYIGNSALGALAASIKDSMNFRMFLFEEGGGTYLAHQLNANTGDIPEAPSKWNVYADEGGVVTWVAFLSSAVTLEEFKELTESQMRGSASWQSCTGEVYQIREASWFNAMFPLGVRSLAGFSISDFDSPAGSLSRYSQYALVPAVLAHQAHGACLEVDHPAFSDAMSQAQDEQTLVGGYTPPNLANIAPTTPPDHVVPHALFVPFNAGPDLPPVTVTRLISEVVELRDDQAGYYHDSGAYPFGFEVIASPYQHDLDYDGADDGRPVFETLSQAYIALSLFNGLQLHDDNETFYTIAAYVPGYEDKVGHALDFLYPNQIYLPFFAKPPCRLGELRFGSGNSQYPEEHSVTIGQNCIQEGANTLILENANPQETGHWVFWDSLRLKDSQGGIVWQLGEDEAPPDYSDAAFDEFDDSSPYHDHFYVGTMPEGQFPAELNDSDISQVTIYFGLTEAQAGSDLTLYLDTLYATHTGAAYFDMQVEVASGD